jgi:ornithine cyclodeaminase/alanine dehydrogenase-like protein (mu-crystallin family)
MEKDLRREGSFLHITDQEVEKVLTMPEVIALMRDAFLAISSRKAVAPLRSFIDIPDFDARALFMPVYIPSLSLIVVKIVSVYPHNSTALGIPNIHGKLLLINAADGVPVCMMDAERLTALRTGAASGLATDILAPSDSEVFAVFGTGVQAYAQVQGVLAVRDIKKILVYGLDVSEARSFASKLQHAFNVESSVAARAELREADIISTATNSRTPVFAPCDVKPGCHINAIGSFKPDMQELPEEIIAGSRVFVDQREACISEAGDIQVPIQKKLIAPDHIAGELGEVLNGHVAGRLHGQDVTVFKSVGNAVQDAYAAHFVWSRHIE